MKKQKYLGIITILATTFLVSCSSVPTTVESGKSNIQVLANQTVPKNCQFRGKVAVSKTNIYGPTHESVQNQQIDILKQQAARLAANTIFITSHQTRYYRHPEYIISESKVQRELDAHAMSGKAYFCPSATLNQLSLKDSSAISDIRPQDE